MSQLLTLIAAAILAWQAMRAFANPQFTTDGWLWIAGAVALTAYAFACSQPLFAEPSARAPSDQDSAPQSPWRRFRMPAGLGLLALSVALNVWANRTLYDTPYHIPATYAWAASLLLALLACATTQADAWSRRAPPVAAAAVPPPTAAALVHPQRQRLLEIGLVAFLLLVAIFFRVYHLDSMPPGIFIDQTNGALDALAILEGRQASPFGTSWYEIPTLYVYFMLGMFKLLGATWLALVLSSIVPALLTVLAVYPLTRTLFGVPTALAATAFLAFNRWHINMSRWGWIEIATPLFQVLCVYFLVRAAKTRRWLDFGLAGLCLGLGMYTYLAIRMAVGAVALYVLYRLIVQRGFWRIWPGLALMALLYAMTFAPLAVHYSRNPFTFLNRSQQVSIFNDVSQAGSYQPLWDNIRRHAEMFTVRGDTNPRHNLPGAPMLDPITGALFLIGVGYALWRIGDHRYGLLLLWIAVTLAGGALSSLAEGPQAFRTIAVTPAVAILAGDMLVRAWTVLRLAFTGRRRSPTGALTGWSAVTLIVPLALLALAAHANFTRFFDEQAHNEAVWQAFSPVETAVAREVQSKLGTHTPYLAPRLYHFSPLIFLTYHAPAAGGGGLANKPYRMAQPVDDLPIPDLSGQDALFLLDTHYQELLELFTAYYPGAAARMVTGPRGQPLYLSVNVPGAEIVALHGLTGDYTGLARRDAQIAFTWPSDWPAGAPPGPVVWTGALRIPASGPVELRSEGDLQIEVDSQPWTGQRFLGKGLHSLRMTQADPATAGRAALFWKLATQPEQPLPPEALFAVDLPKNGLKATYYTSESWSGEPVFSVIVPLALFAWTESEPWPTPFSSSFSGQIEISSAGAYQFYVNGDDGVRLWLDGQVVGESLRPDTANEFSVTVHLTAGRHPLRLDHFQRGGGKALELWWQPPNAPRQVVPPHVLWPEP